MEHETGFGIVEAADHKRLEGSRRRLTAPSTRLAVEGITPRHRSQGVGNPNTRLESRTRHEPDEVLKGNDGRLRLWTAVQPAIDARP